MQAAVLPLVPIGPAAHVPEAAHDAALDEREAWQGFSRELAGGEGLWESYVGLDGIDCAGCSLLIEQALLPVAGVRSVEVNGATATARIVWQPTQGRPSQWLAALRAAGYRGWPTSGQLEAATRRQAQRQLLWRWLVAGFCMMQVMMYAAPAYLAAPGEMTADVAALLRWASWLLTLPVLLFSCRPFFTAAWRDLAHRRIGMDVPVAAGILLAFTASTAATFDATGPLGSEVWYDSLTMFVFFLLSGRLLEQRLRERTAGSLEALIRRLPSTVERELDDGSCERIAASRLRVGDRVRVLPGEAVPADGTVLRGASRVDEALLTGESAPLARTAGDAVIAGSHNLSGPLLVRVERLGADTRFAGIVALMERASVDKPRLARLADRVAGPFLVGVLAAAALAAWWWWPVDRSHAVGVAIAVLIVTCPCALSLATPAAMLAAAGALARRGILVRRLEALEEGAAIDAVVFDKTGTLTSDRLALAGMQVRDGLQDAPVLQWAAALARHSLHPLSRAIAAAPGAGELRTRDVQECAGQGLRGVLDIDGKAVALRLGSAAFCNAPPHACAAQLHLANAQGWLAAFTLDEQLRGDAAATIGQLAREGLALQVLSGDRPEAVQRLAERAGIAAGLGGQSPEDKLSWVRGQQRQGRRVLVVGDGLNDGPVLASANVSVAMGHGAPLAQSQADVIVAGGQLAAVPLLLHTARRTRAVVRQNLAWSAAYNAVCVPLAIAGWMPPWLAGLGMAASSLVVVANAARLARSPRPWPLAPSP